ncbi:RlpA-like double-psi beta-barrel domain-containing protein [Actinomadura terrae]|uniref:RlpA-like double-psi beta-barrel domain-containing protein n=1 Tax=Actinomadura terrae TaxID=604353 RepID=UPI001FA7F402|nr:RlpA-like double-psi beta-barrel domain-containing protein [Actinomadura terrae]
MQQRAINVVLTGITGAAMAGMLVAGVAAASDDSAPSGDKRLLSQQAMNTQEHKTAHEGGRKDSKSTSKDSAKRTKKSSKALLAGKTTASYFWDDGSGVNGDTGAPAGGKPMQKGLFASPSWPLHTKVRVTYDGRSVTGFVGDRGPGSPSHRGVMLDLDTYTFRYLLDGEKPSSKYNAGTGEGHIKGVKWEVLKWGSGAGKRGAPRPLG